MRAVHGLLVSLLFSTTALAQQECLQRDAIYEDTDKAHTLRFIPPDSEAVVSSNQFRIEVNGTDIVLDGFVIWSQGESRPNATIMFQCPVGDVTGEELEKCVIWEGVPYELKAELEADLLPPDEEPAAAAILLPDFGRALRYSTLWGEKSLDIVPWDVFTFKACRN